MPVLPRRLVLAATCCLALALAGGCTVRPLYSDGAASEARPGTPAATGGVFVKPVETRYAQEVRNELIFLLNGGDRQAAEPRYELTLIVTRQAESAAAVQIAGENEPTAGTLTLTAFYVLTDTTTGANIGQGRRSISSAYDRPRQEFAELRAERDAEDRAARELAELVRLAVAQDLAAAPVPAAVK